MRIIIKPDVYAVLQTIAVQAAGTEFSGFGFVNVENDDIIVYDFKLMAWGSSAFTEIMTKKIVELTSSRKDARNMRLWVHKHPMGGAAPGPANWSGTDNKTIKENPLGSNPSMVSWSSSMVLTAAGRWVGRVDVYDKDPAKPGEIVQHTEHVEVKVPVPYELFNEVVAVKQEWYAASTKAWEEMYGQQKTATGARNTFFRNGNQVTTYPNYYGQQNFWTKNDARWQGEITDDETDLESRGSQSNRKKEDGVVEDINESSGIDAWVIVDDIYQRYLEQYSLTDREKEILKEAFMVDHVPPIKLIRELEERPVDEDWTDEDWIELTTFYEMCDEYSVMENEMLEFEIEDISFRLRTGQKVSEEDRNLLIRRIGVRDYSLLVEERERKDDPSYIEALEHRDWLDKPMSLALSKPIIGTPKLETGEKDEPYS